MTFALSMFLVTVLQKFSDYFGDEKGKGDCATLRNCATKRQEIVTKSSR